MGPFDEQPDLSALMTSAHLISCHDNEVAVVGLAGTHWSAVARKGIGDADFYWPRPRAAFAATRVLALADVGVTADSVLQMLTSSDSLRAFGDANAFLKWWLAFDPLAHAGCALPTELRRMRMLRDAHVFAMRGALAVERGELERALVRLQNAQESIKRVLAATARQPGRRAA